MGRKFAVEKLEDEQFDFVVGKILDGLTDREVCAAVKKEYDIELALSSFNRWRKKAGEELAERYRLKRFQARSFVENLKTEGIEVAENTYQQIISNLEDHLLTAERELIAENPVKLLFARQEDERIKLKREKLELDKQQLAFEREKHRNAVDRVKIGAETMMDFLAYSESDPASIQFLTQHLQPFGEYLKSKYAPEN